MVRNLQALQVRLSQITGITDHMNIYVICICNDCSVKMVKYMANPSMVDGAYPTENADAVNAIAGIRDQGHSSRYC